jgi:polar amino acid transport system substrate-binding protein
MKSIKKKPIMILLMAALMATFIVGLCACGKSDSKKVACVDDLEGAKIGVQLGTTGDIYAAELRPKAMTATSILLVTDASTT